MTEFFWFTVGLFVAFTIFLIKDNNDDNNDDEGKFA